MRTLGTRTVRILFQAVGVALFIVILAKVDRRQVWNAYRSIDLASAALGVILLFLLTLLKSLRWRRIVGVQNVRVPLWMAFRVYAASLYLGVVTPGHIGDLAKSFYLTGRGMPVGKAVFSSVADRLFDVVFLVVVGYGSLLLFPGIFRNQLLMSSLVLVLVASAVAALSWRRDLLMRFVRACMPGKGGSGIGASLARGIDESIGEFGLLSGGTLAAASALTIAAWLCHYLFFIIFAGALGLGAPVSLLVVSVSIAVFVSLVPVSISGLGTRDLVLILVFARAGLSKEAAVAFSFSFILVYILQGLVGLACWLTVPLQWRKGGEPLVDDGAS